MATGSRTLEVKGLFSMRTNRSLTRGYPDAA